MSQAPGTLAEVLDDAWQRLERGARDRRSGFHTGVLATLGDDGPDARTVVLRGADREQAQLRFHSDARAAKLAQLARCAEACFVAYQSPVQLRLRGTIGVYGPGDPICDAAWASTRPGSRRCYLVEPAPGARLEGAGDGLPEQLRERAPLPSETEAGRENFRVLRLEVRTLDWLWLAARGHRRARFSRQAGEPWIASWCVP